MTARAERERSTNTLVTSIRFCSNNKFADKVSAPVRCDSFLLIFVLAAAKTQEVKVKELRY